MSEFIAAIIGGLFTLAGTFIALIFQFRKDERDKREDYHNDLVSSLDVIAYKAAKVRNNYLDFNYSNFNKDNTTEIYQEIHTDFKGLDKQLQSLILLMSHHSDNSNKVLRRLLTSYEPVENQFNNFKISYKIYTQKYESPDFNKNNITFSKRKLDISIKDFIAHIKNFASEKYQHDLYEPTLNNLVDPNDAINNDKYYQK